MVLAAGCTSAGQPAAGPDVARARAVLAAQAQAIRGHDRAALVATIDPSAAARAFRRKQRAALSNLAAVPLAGWRYGVVGPIHDGAAIRAARARYGAPVLLLHVRLEYRLGGVDTVPDSHDLYDVFTERDGRTYLAGDDALAATGSPSWVAPWQYGPLAIARGRSSLVLGPPADRPRLPGLARAVDAAIGAVSTVWGRGWSRRVAVLIPASAAEFSALTGSGVVDVSAAAVTGGIDAASGRPYGQRLVLNPGQLDRLSDVGEGIVLRHEVTHLASAADTSDITPRWLAEGVAEYVANLGTGQPVRVAAGELAAAVAAGSVPTALPGEDAFAGSGAALARAYESAWLACRLIAARVGAAGLVRFYRAVGTALEPAGPALADAFRTVLRESEASFTGQWRRYLEDQLS
jgi:hypothetical protein